MPGFELARSAESDIRSIALYTLEKWGAKQAAHYTTILDAHFEAIANGKARTRTFLQHRPELLVSRVEHHYVFHLNRRKQCPLILAVLHENMDLVLRLRDRLRIE